ncbi:MAG: hypothetical protein EP333_10005 [Bacteroidetes bacterium]|nr:MAG: hypothetical protein EP333_10005 [Bacteroidota bacterium]
MFKRLLLVLIVLFSAELSMAQGDTTEYKVMDVIYLKEGGILRGEILAFDESNGGIVFKDEYGRKYSFGRDDYKYFREDQLIKNKKKAKNKEVYQRKEEGLSFNVGLKFNFISLNDNFTPDDYYLNGFGGLGDIVTSLSLGGGMYFTRQHFVALNTDFKVASFGYAKQYFNAGIRYQYQYDAQKSNVALYLPFELKYNRYSEDIQYDVNDTIVDSGPGGTVTYWPISQEYGVTVDMASLSIGHGFGFIMKNRKSFNIEVGLTKYFVLSQKFSGTTHGNPQSSFDGFAMNLSLLYNL